MGLDAQGTYKSLFFAGLPEKPFDALLALARDAAADDHPDRIDLSVGVYRNELGTTPVPQSIKRAEQQLVTEQPSKVYLGPGGDPGFLELLGNLAFDQQTQAQPCISLQSVGGAGALRLAADLVKTIRPGAAILLGLPSWPNHEPLFAAAGLEVLTYDYFDVRSQSVQFDQMIAAVLAAKRDDVLVLHGCCHNPTGADLSPDQWLELAETLERRGVIPLIDLAYLGFGSDITQDAAGFRSLIQNVPEAMVAISCSKIFGLYRERTGALFVFGSTSAEMAACRSHLLQIARTSYSMPPDHGASVVRTILADPGLEKTWREELATMRSRIRANRQIMSTEGGAIELTWLAQQNGIFSVLSISQATIRRLRQRHHIYIPDSGRISLAGLNCHNIARFIAALGEEEV